MFTAALLAAAAVRLVATDPLGVASLAAADDVATLLGRVASRIAGWF